MSRQYVKDNAKHLNMNQLNALLADDGLGKSCEYSMETLWNRKSELAEKQSDDQFDSYIASMFEAAQYFEACFQVVMRTAKELIQGRREAFRKFIVKNKAEMNFLISEDYDSSTTYDLYHDATFYCIEEKKFFSPFMHLNGYDLWSDDSGCEYYEIRES